MTNFDWSAYERWNNRLIEENAPEECDACGDDGLDECECADKAEADRDHYFENRD